MRSGRTVQPATVNAPGPLTQAGDADGVLGRLVRSSPLGIVVTRGLYQSKTGGIEQTLVVAKDVGLQPWPITKRRAAP